MRLGEHWGEGRKLIGAEGHLRIGGHTLPRPPSEGEFTAPGSQMREAELSGPRRDGAWAEAASHDPRGKHPTGEPGPLGQGLLPQLRGADVVKEGLE